MNTFFCRAFQCCFAVGARFLPWRTPEVFSGEGSLLRAADILRENDLRRPFVIASRRQCADEHFRALQEKLDEQDILLSIFRILVVVTAGDNGGDGRLRPRARRRGHGDERRNAAADL